MHYICGDSVECDFACGSMVLHYFKTYAVSKFCLPFDRLRTGGRAVLYDSSVFCFCALRAQKQNTAKMVSTMLPQANESGIEATA